MRVNLVQFKNFIKGSDDLFAPVAAFFSCFVLTFVMGSFVIRPQGTRAVTGLGLASTPTMTLYTSANVNLNIIPAGTSSGIMSAGSQTVTSTTNVPTGYNLTLATVGVPTLATTTGTLSAPTALSNNTWGYALPKVSSSTSANTVTNGFDASYAVPTPSTTSKWANPTAATIIKNATAAAANDATTIYYAARTNTSLAASTYTNNVRYTATANIANIPSPTIISITPSVGPTTGLTAVQIIGTGFTVNDQSVTTAVAIGGVACTNVTISSNTPSTGRDTIYCTNAVHPTAGATDVVVTTWKSSATLTNGYTYAVPMATITSPTASQTLTTGTASTTLAVTTNYTSICYYGTVANPTTQMVNTASTTHSQTITGLVNGSTNTRYVRCQAAAGHSYGSNVGVTFYVKAAIPAAPNTSPANGSTVQIGTTTITVASSGATCKWGTTNGNYPNNSGATRTTTTGTNILYYSCVAGSGNTTSDVRTGSWSYTGAAAPAAPATPNPPNISATNQQVLDVYPTTGWAGDKVAITSNALFTSISAVTIGGTACTSYSVITTSLITCTLPSKTAGTTNDIVVTNSGVNVTNAATYKHMKVTYFNPSNAMVSIGGTTYNFYPFSFTSANCSAMTASNAGILSTPATSMVYVRDTRNNQTYKVKKMADNKCWMVDSLKYINANMTFNNGDHLNNGGSAAFNTTTETVPFDKSASLLDKRFYNNPMAHSYCYSLSDTITNTLTHCGYDYNWYAATNGTGLYATAGSTNVTGSICPTNFRLPSYTSDGITPTGNGTLYNMADIDTLSVSMEAGAPTPGTGAITNDFYAGWQPTGAWGGVLSGAWYSIRNTPSNAGEYGLLWTSTAGSADSVRRPQFSSDSIITGIFGSGVKWGGNPVRCVMP